MSRESTDAVVDKNTNSRMSLDAQIRELGAQAKAASHVLGGLDADRKNRILDAMADALDAGRTQSGRPMRRTSSPGAKRA